jgi:hypothetical protein
LARYCASIPKEIPYKPNNRAFPYFLPYWFNLWHRMGTLLSNLKAKTSPNAPLNRINFIFLSLTSYSKPKREQFSEFYSILRIIVPWIVNKVFQGIPDIIILTYSTRRQRFNNEPPIVLPPSVQKTAKKQEIYPNRSIIGKSPPMILAAYEETTKHLLLMAHQ